MFNGSLLQDDLDTDQQPVGSNRVGTKKLKKLQAKADKKATRDVCILGLRIVAFI